MEVKTNTTENQNAQQTLKGSELGLKMYTGKSTGWPKTTLTLKQIAKNLKESNINSHVHITR